MAKDLISDSSDTTDLLRKLRAGSEFLESQSEELVEILDGKKVVSFYELLGTQTVKKVRIAQIPFSKSVLIRAKVYADGAV
jgi:hypothetical protein